MTDTTENPATKLLDVLDRLTIEHVVTTKLDTGKKHFEKHDALIVQLRKAVASDLGGVGGKLPHERTPLDADALTKYDQIERAILDRYREVSDTVPGMYPEETLRSWYAAWLGTNPTDNDYEYEIATLTGWARIIEEKLAPPTTRELVGEECPECGFAWYDTVVNASRRDPDHPATDEDWREPPPGQRRTRNDRWNWVEKERRPALTVSYRPDDQGGLTKSFAKCGNCNHVWMGSSGIRALAYDIEQRHAAEEAARTKPM